MVAANGDSCAAGRHRQRSAYRRLRAAAARSIGRRARAPLGRARLEHRYGRGRTWRADPHSAARGGCARAAARRWAHPLEAVPRGAVARSTILRELVRSAGASSRRGSGSIGATSSGRNGSGSNAGSSCATGDVTGGSVLDCRLGDSNLVSATSARACEARRQHRPARAVAGATRASLRRVRSRSAKSHGPPAVQARKLDGAVNVGRRHRLPRLGVYPPRHFPEERLRLRLRLRGVGTRPEPAPARPGRPGQPRAARAAPAPSCLPRPVCLSPWPPEPLKKGARAADPARVAHAADRYGGNMAFSQRLAQAAGLVEARLGGFRRPGAPTPRRGCSTPCAMARSAAASGLRPFLVIECAGLFGVEATLRCRRRRARVRALLFPGARRPAGHGRRRPAPRPADRAQGLRRGDRHPGRRRAAHAGLRAAGRPARRTPTPPSAPSWCSGSRGLPAPAGMAGGQCLDLRGRQARRARRARRWRTCSACRP